MTNATDGASLRHKRLFDMLLYINSNNGATMVMIQTYMLTAHGLKFKTTAQYVKECMFAKILRTDGNQYKVVQNKIKLEGSY